MLKINAYVKVFIHRIKQKSVLYNTVMIRIKFILKTYKVSKKWKTMHPSHGHNKKIPK